MRSLVRSGSLGAGLLIVSAGWPVTVAEEPGSGLRPALTQPLVVTTLELTAVKDNTLYESPTGSLSNGQGVRLFAGRTGSGAIRRALVAFDVASAVPSGSTITSAAVQMNMSRTITGPFDVRLHRVLADWGEGSSNDSGEEGSGAPSTAGDATWIHRFFNTVFWSTPGGDFAAAPSASRTIGGIGLYTWPSNAQLVADVQGWVDNPATNFGWIVIGDEETFPTAKRFDSSENANAANRPKVIIEFTGPPTGSCCWGIGGPFGGVCQDGLTEAECNDQLPATFFRENRVCNDNACNGCPECTPNEQCDDSDACTDDHCNASEACCEYVSNYDPATECCDPQTGAIQSLDDPNPCTGPGVCDSQSGQVTFPPLTGTNCDDGQACTTNDRCNASGACLGESVVCDDGNRCTRNDRCDPASGQCISDPVVCDDDDACTRNDRCDPSTGGCVADPVTGLACTANPECSPGACIDNRCQCPAAPSDIPTLSEWGGVVLGLLLLVGAKVYFGRMARPVCLAAPMARQEP